MCLLGDLNWWAPRPLAGLYHRLNLGESLAAYLVAEVSAA
jgi:hypothetical protein